MVKVALVVALSAFWLQTAHAQTGDVLARADALRNAGQYDSAIVLLREAHRRSPGHAPTELMLGETLYWQGDYTSAARHFENVLRMNPQNAAARRQLDEIRTVSAPWLRLGYQHDDDNQPLTRNTAQLEAGFFINPLWSIGVRASGQTAASGNVQFDYREGQAELAGYLPRARLDVRLAAGIAATASEPGLFSGYVGEPVGQLEIGRRIGGGLRISASVERELYTATAASLMNPVPLIRARARAQLDRRNWLGEGAVQQETYTDDNATLTTYAWLLAPLAVTSSMMLQAGYAFSWQDSRESRFTSQGIYDPYFTPENEISHSVAGSFVAWRQNGARLQVNGSYAFYGSRGVPGLIPAPPPGPGNPNRGPRSFTEESYHPYNVRIAAALPVTARSTFSVEAERMRTSFYQNTRVAALFSIRFAPRPAS